MKNLRLQGERKRCVHAPNHASNDEGSAIIGICSVYGGTTSSSQQRAILTHDGYVALIDDLRDDPILWEVSLNDLCTTKISDEWFSLTYLDAVGQVVCLNRKNGSIVTVHAETGQAELVGEFENGIHAAAWSPDKEVLLLVTAAEDDEDHNQQKSVLLTMSSQFDVLAEEKIERMSLSGDDHEVAVCWTRSSFAVSSVDEVDNQRKIRIFKGDTLELVAMGRTEDGSGKLVSNLLPSPIAWAGTACSHLLAAVQRKGKKNKQIAFFEPNGLRHRELLLRDAGDGTTVVGLDWNVESDLLAVTLQTELDWKVQLWHRSNYHWYLKREWCFEDAPLSCVQFHEEDPYLLFVAIRRNRLPQQGGQQQQQHQQLCWIELKVRWDSATVNQCSNISTDAFSIDGNLLNVTDFEKAFIPPPMYGQTLSLDAPVCEIAFAREAESAIYGVVLLSSGAFVILGRDAKSGRLINRLKAVNTAVSLQQSDNAVSNFQVDPLSFRELVLVAASTSSVRFLAVATSWENPGQDFLVELIIALSSDGMGEARITSTHALDERCLTLSPWSDSAGGALLQLDDGSLLEYEFGKEGGKGNLTPSMAEALLEPCPWLVAINNVEQLFENNEEHHTRRQRLVVGMSPRYRLYLHDILLADSVSSFYLSLENKYLCYASAGSRCVLRFLALVDLCSFDPLAGSDENHAVLEGYEPRNIERGSRIVALVSRQPTAVLQMPRGNLEIVHPRALVLRHVMIGTQRGLYKKTFEMMRKQKVDLNLIIDMNPWNFLQDGVTAFVEQIQSIDHLNLFIAGLQNWNSTEQRYPIPHWLIKNGRNTSERESDRPFDFTTKVNQVCSVLRAVMVQAELNLKTSGGRPVSEWHYLLPILSTFAKEDPPRLGDALLMIKENSLKRHDPSKSNKPALFSETAQSAIHYLAFLADYEQLFETALGLYDYDLTRAVARNSQMDPKVYLPLLKRYKKLPMYYARFEVDVRLKRFESALRNLSKSGALGEVVGVDDPSIANYDVNGNPAIGGNDFDACQRLIEEHKLYRLGLELFGEKEQRTRLVLSLGDHLLEWKQPDTALSVYLSADPIDYNRCERAAREANDWAALFSLLRQTPKPKNQETLAREISSSLAATAEGHVDRRARLVDASRVLLDYAEDISGAVEMLVQAENWSEAKRISCLHRRDDLTNRVVDAAVEFAYTLIDDFAERAEAFRDASERYDQALQLRKDTISTEGEPAHTGDRGDDGSLFSAASNTSNLSTTSTSSTGSVGSLSSVISVKSTTSFTVSGFEDSTRHKSRFNKLGQDKKKQKKKKRKSNKVRPGSEEELQNLVQTLRVNCVDEVHCATVAETVTFLVQNGKLNVGLAVFDKFEWLCETIRRTQEERKEAQQKRDLEKDLKSRREGFGAVPKTMHSVETEVDALTCSSLPATLVQLFSFLPSE